MKKHFLVLLTTVFCMKGANSIENSSNLDFFDRNIYKQKGINKESPTYTDEAKNRLYELKEQQFNKHVKEEIEIKLKGYEEHLKIAYEQQKVHNISGICKGIIEFLMTPITIAASIYGGNAGIGLGNPTSGLAQIIDNSISIAQGSLDLKTQIPIYYNKIFELKMDIETRRNKLRLESIKKLEEEYVTHKKLIHKTRRYEIERALIDTRKGKYPLFDARAFVQDALKLPLSHTNIFVSKYKLWKDIQKEFPDHAFFSKLSGQTHYEDLKDFVKEIVFASDTGDPSRIVRLFVGNSGVGKTFTAEQIAQYVGLPCYDSPIGTYETIAGQGFFGEFWGNPTHKPGASAQIFLKTGTKNPILVINEFDKYLDGVQGSNSRFFTETLLDPSKTEILNEYFNGKIDFKHLIVILTANKDVSDEYPALQSRLKGKTINFPDCTPELATEILLEKCKKFSVHYHSIFKTQEEFQGIIQDAINKQGSKDIRVLETYAEKMFIKGDSDPMAGAEAILLNKCKELKTQYNLKDKPQKFFENMVQKVLELGSTELSVLEAALVKELEKESNEEVKEVTSSSQEISPMSKAQLAYIAVGNEIIALDPTNKGTVAWLNNIKLDKGHTTPAIYYDKGCKLLFACRDGYAWAFNPDNGKQVWSNDLKGFGTKDHPTITTNANSVFFGFNGRVVAFDKESIEQGKDVNPQWHQYIAKHAYVALEPVGNLLHVAGNGYVYVFNTDTVNEEKVYNKHPNTGEANNIISLNENMICHLYNNYLVVDQRKNLETLFKKNLSNKGTSVLCDDVEQDKFYLSTLETVQCFSITPSSLLSETKFNWSTQHGGYSLNFFHTSQDQRLLAVANNSSIAAFFTDSGKEAWKFELPKDLSANNLSRVSVLPLLDRLLISKGGRFLALSADEGKLLWTNKEYETLDTMSSCMASKVGKPSNSVQLLADIL